MNENKRKALTKKKFAQIIVIGCERTGCEKVKKHYSLWRALLEFMIYIIRGFKEITETNIRADGINKSSQDITFYLILLRNAMLTIAVKSI